MATFKICVRSQRADGYWTVFIRCTHNRKSDYLLTGKLVDDKGLTKEKNIKDPFVLSECSRMVTEFIDRINKIDITHWNVKEVTSYLNSLDDDICFSNYARKFKREMETIKGMVRNARNYEYAYQSLERFAGTNQLMFSRFTTKFLNDWIKSLESTSRAKEMYPICIRQIFRQAINDYNDYDRQIIRIKTNPWLKVKIPSADIPEKKAIAYKEIHDFFSVPLPDSKFKISVAELGRDVAMMIICLAGINTVDLFHLKKNNFENGIIRYNRRKTMKYRRDKAYLEISVPEIIKPLFDKYKPSNESDHLFDFSTRYSNEESFNANVNGGIHDVCDVLGIAKDKRYSSYTFRHTWGTTAQNYCAASTEDVAFAMNHATAHKVTEGYIKKDYSRISILNQKVIDYLFNNADPQRGDVYSVNSPELRISPKYQIRGTAIYRQEILYSFTDTGYNNIREAISELAKNLPDYIPKHSIVQFKIENLDKDEVKIYDRQKGKGF